MANFYFEGNNPRKQKQRIAWSMENYKKMPRNKVAVIDALPMNKSGQVSIVSNATMPTNRTVLGFAENSVKSIVSKENKLAGTSVLKWVEHTRSFPGYLGNRTKDVRFARIKKNVKMANRAGGIAKKSTKNNLNSSGSSTKRRSSSSSDGSIDFDQGKFPCRNCHQTRSSKSLIRRHEKKTCKGKRYSNQNEEQSDEEDTLSSENGAIPVHFKFGAAEFTKIIFSRALEKDRVEYTQSKHKL